MYDPTAELQRKRGTSRRTLPWAARVLALHLLLVSATLATSESPSAWQVLERRHPEQAARATAEERRVLALLCWEQVIAWMEGLDPSRIELADGRTLAAVLGSGVDLSWWTLDGGGGRSAGGGYTVSGTLGQPDAGVLTGGGYALGGGFWPLDSHFIFRDGFESGSAARWSGAVGVVP